MSKYVVVNNLFVPKTFDFQETVYILYDLKYKTIKTVTLTRDVVKKSVACSIFS